MRQIVRKLREVTRETQVLDAEHSGESRRRVPFPSPLLSRGGVLTGRSDGSSPAILFVSGREFGDFELRFEARVHRGAVRVKMHGPGPGPLGVALEINSATVEWFSNSVSAFVVANNRPDNWNEYRVVVGGHQFKVWQNGISSALDLVVSHADVKGKLSLHLSEGKPSEVALRRIRIKEWATSGIEP